MLDLIRQFLMDDRTLTLALLIGVDLVTGVIAALRTGRFQWQRVADFYGHNVVPGLIGYLLIYALGALNAGRLPELQGVIELLTQWAGAGVLAVALLASIAANLREGPPPAP